MQWLILQLGLACQLQNNKKNLFRVIDGCMLSLSLVTSTLAVQSYMAMLTLGLFTPAVYVLYVCMYTCVRRYVGATLPRVIPGPAPAQSGGGSVSYEEEETLSFKPVGVNTLESGSGELCS